MTRKTALYFYLFEIVEYNFERKLQPSEYPHNLYIQNYSTATSTCLCIRKWLFSLSQELSLMNDTQATSYIFWQAVDEVNRGCIHAGERLYQLKALQDVTRATEYLKLARDLSGYGEVVFPHCPCDSRKEGHVIVSAGSKGFKLHACQEDGTLESQVVHLSWDCIRQWEVDDEAMAFCLRYDRPDKTPRWLKIYSPYYSYLLDCFERIVEENKWIDTGE
ncbi:sorting nexin-27-like [Agrilus planipennis]|nr:sorting nexin-27-like [Agrilus planipennis]